MKQQMKKIIVLIAIAILPFTNYAQNSIFDKFEEMDDVTTVVVTKEAFKMLAKFKSGGEEGAEDFDMVKGLNSFRVFTTENPDISKQMSNVVSKYLKSGQVIVKCIVQLDKSNPLALFYIYPEFVFTQYLPYL